MRSLWTAACACLLLVALAARAETAPEESQDGRIRLYLKAMDPNGGKLNFFWKQIEGPTVKAADPAACAAVTENGKLKYVSDTYFIATEPGIYKFEVTVKSDAGDEKKTVIVREVLAPAPPPVAVTGKDKEATLGQIVVLNGIDSRAAPGRSITEWEWRLVSPEKFKIDARKLKERQFDFKAEKPGVYQFELRVFDGKHWSEPAQLRVTIKPKMLPLEIEVTDQDSTKVELSAVRPEAVPAKPVLKASAAPGKTIKLGEALVLDGSASSADPKFKPSFIWEQIWPEGKTGPVARTLAPDKSKPFSGDRPDLWNYPVWTCKPPAPGDYTFILRLECLDSRGEPVKAESEPVVFHVAAANTPPAANIFAERTEVEAGDMVLLDGSASRDADGDKIIDYIWGPVAGKRYPRNWAGVDGPKVQFRADEEGSYAVALIVTDGKDRSEPAQVSITVRGANKPPAIELQPAFETVTNGKLRIEAKVSDPESDPFTLAWGCIDPKTLLIPEDYANNAVLVFVPRDPGQFVFRLTATDSKGKRTEALTTVTVKPAGEKPPTAVIDGPKAAKAGSPVLLSAARSASFPAGKPLAYTWTQTEGPAVQLEPSAKNKGKTCSFTAAEPGRYVISLTVADGDLKSEPERFEIQAARDNAPPAANIAGPADGKLVIGTPVTLDGAGSEDPDKDKLSFKWRKTGGTAEADLTGADQDRCTVTARTAGTVQIELIVNDGSASSQPARIDLLAAAPRTKPTAKITGPETAKAGAMVTLSAAGSSSSDGAEITYTWSQSGEDGGPAIGVRGSDMRKRDLRFRAEKPGIYVLKLEVVDAEGLQSDPVTHKIEVKGLNRPPRAVAALAEPGPFAAGKEVKLTARGSLDPEGGALTYKWKQSLGQPLQFPQESSEILNLLPSVPGDYEFELVVSDGENDSPPAKVPFTVQAPNRTPVAVIATLPPCEAGEKTVLDGTGSKDEDSDKLEYKWNQVAGPEVRFGLRGTVQPKQEIVLPKEGEYVFELKVFDGKEWSEPVRAAVKTLPPNAAPVAVSDNPAVRTEELTETILDASASYDPDHGPQPLKFIWRAMDARVELASDGPTARFTPKKVGTYTFQVKVSDGKLQSPPAEIKVVVMKAGILPVASVRADPNPVKAAQKGINDDQTLLILDGRASRPGSAAAALGKPVLTYRWTQVSGEDLRLRPEQLAKERIGLHIFIPGTYKWKLEVSDGQNTSRPAFIEVKVLEGAAQPVQERKAAPEGPQSMNPARRTLPPAENKTAAARKPAPAASAAAPAASDDAAREQELGATLLPPKDAQEPAAASSGTASREKQALEALASDPSPEAEQKLAAALASSDQELRAAAAAALYRRGVNGVPALIGVLEQGSDVARREAHQALKQLTHETLSMDARQWRNWWAQQPMSKEGPLLAVPR